VPRLDSPGLVHRALALTLVVALVLPIAARAAPDPLPGDGARARGTAATLFTASQGLVYQIRVIDLVSGDKVSIGSGFRVTAEGHIATNFHVVASYAHEREKFRLEYVARDGSSGGLDLEAVDVVHDLAIVRADLPDGAALTLASGDLSKGDRVYSMGNPHDLGMTIIEGTYNGLIGISRYEKILFSGSLNPGMSGGPAMTARGEVMGVNVSKGGEQISFLVPAKFLERLLERVLDGTAETDFEAAIGEALVADQRSFYGALLDEPLETEAYGEFELPVKLSPALKCWGHTVDDTDDEQYVRSHRHCATEDVIFIDDGFMTGELFYDYEWLTPGGLNLFQFYAAVESRFEHRNHQNTFDAEDVTGYECVNDFVRVGEHVFKASSCQRAYLRYAGLYDLLFLMASVDLPDRALVVRIGATGIGRGEALSLVRRFLEAIR